MPEKPAPTTSGTAAEQVLSQCQTGREVVQDFVPLPESLEWDLGQQYLKDRGNKSFISDSSPVPFVINNDGTLSHNAAEVFFTSLVEAEQAGDLEPDIYVLELGIGVGLFARFFLDHFRDLSRQYRKDFYDRLTYIAADKSERMLTDMLTHGLLANHAGHYRTRVVDAMEPDKELPFDVAFMDHPYRDKPLRAVFLNYLLDCLPAAVLEIDVAAADVESADWKSAATTIRQLCVRTCVARNIKLADHTDMMLEQLQQRARQVASGQSAAGNDPRQELLEVYGLFASEYDYRPVDVKTLPYGDFAIEYARRTTRRLLLSYGAMQCLDKLLGMVQDDGFILINDYGQTKEKQRGRNSFRDEEKRKRRLGLARKGDILYSKMSHLATGVAP